VFADSRLLIDGSFMRSCEKRNNCSTFRESYFGIFMSGNPIFITELTLPNITGTNKPPVAIVVFRFILFSRLCIAMMV